MPLALARRLTGKLVFLGHVVGTQRHPGQLHCSNTGGRGARSGGRWDPPYLSLPSPQAVLCRGQRLQAHNLCAQPLHLGPGSARAAPPVRSTRAAAPLTLSLVAAVAALAFSRGAGLAGGGGALAKHAGHRLPAQLLHQLGVVHCKAGGKAQVSWGLW